VLTVLPDGKSVEVGLIGKEGFVGSAIVFDYKTSPLRVVVQADATAYRVDVPTLRKILPECPTLEKKIQRFAMALAMQSTQLAACNRLHDVEYYMFLHLAEARIMVQSWSTNWCQPLLNTLLGATRVAYFQSVTRKPGSFTAMPQAKRISEARTDRACALCPFCVLYG
jgi:hypothetical protein